VAHPTRPLAHRARAALRVAAALADAVATAPAMVEPAPVTAEGGLPLLRPGQTLRVLVWNVQFCAGRSRKFFYDGGDAVHVPPGDVYATIDRVAAVLRAEDADLVLLQEVDRGSDRTGRVDQHAEILARSPYPCHTSVPYHRNRYVPHPPANPLGRMDLHLSLYSRAPVGEARRIALPERRADPWIRRQFDLRRAILEVDLPLADGRVLRVGDVHLSAFTGGDGTLRQQVARVHDRLSVARAERIPALYAGDFNALPPDDDPHRLGAHAGAYLDDRGVLEPLYTDFTSAIPREAHQDEPERWRTYLPFGADAPERALDHAFTQGLDVLDAAVLTGHDRWSDHLPLRLEIAVPG
jgi:endonuclease/exonuclease/phosphatase family metal-dependent hydrolase